MVYTITPALVDYDCDVWSTDQYYVMGFFGEKYVPVNIVNSNGNLTMGTPKAGKMGKLVMDDSDKYTFKTGETFDLGDGYALEIDQIDVNGSKVNLRFLKDGQLVNSSIVTSGNNWILRKTVLGEKDTQILRVRVSSVFQGT